MVEEDILQAVDGESVVDGQAAKSVWKEKTSDCADVYQ